MIREISWSRRRANEANSVRPRVLGVSMDFGGGPPGADAI